ncbi:cation:proton antiporter [Actinophytocola sediminis]
MITVLVAAAALLTARLVGRFAVRVGQAPIMGEVVATILLGSVVAAVVPSGIPGAPVLGWVGKVGVLLFIFAIGQHLEPRTLGADRPLVRRVLLAAVVPAGLAGAGLALLANWTGALRGDAPLPALVIFGIVAMTMTAVPVLSRILTETNLLHTRIGVVSMTSATTIDAISWLLLSVGLALASGAGAATVALTGVGVLVSLVVATLGLARLLRGNRGLARAEQQFPIPMALVLGATVVLAGVGVERLHMPALIGAFLLGVALPRMEVTRWLSRCGGVLLPLYFFSSALGVRLHVPDAPTWVAIGLVTTLAVVTKMGAVYWAVKNTDLTRRESGLLAALMNTRGLTELVVIQIGLTAGLLTPGAYTSLLVMSITTTLLSGHLAMRWSRSTATSTSTVHDRPNP